MPSFSDHLFWDVDRGSVDPVRHGAWLVRRVLEYGRWEDFSSLLECYGKSEVGRLATSLRSLEPRALSFCSAYFEIPKSEFRCSTPIASQLRSEEVLARDLSAVGGTVVHRAPNSLTLDVKGVKVDLLRYGYRTLEPVEVMDGIRLAGVQDVAAMKLGFWSLRSVFSQGWAMRLWISTWLVSLLEASFHCWPATGHEAQ